MREKNRYDGLLRRYNQSILNLIPSNTTLREILAVELKKSLREIKDPRIIELAIGEGDQTKYLFKHNPFIEVEAVDISKKMIISAKNELWKFRHQINYHHQNAKKFLKGIDQTKTYDAVVASWFIHNLPWVDKQELTKDIHYTLKPGGKLYLFDKIYPNSEKESERLFQLQNERYSYLDSGMPDSRIRDIMIAHEYQDSTKEFRMTEKNTRELMHTSGFSEIKIVSRVERDAVLIATKKA